MIFTAKIALQLKELTIGRGFKENGIGEVCEDAGDFFPSGTLSVLLFTHKAVGNGSNIKFYLPPTLQFRGGFRVTCKSSPPTHTHTPHYYTRHTGVRTWAYPAGGSKVTLELL